MNIIQVKTHRSYIIKKRSNNKVLSLSSIPTVKEMEYIRRCLIAEYILSSLLESKIIHVKPVLYLYGNNTVVIDVDCANTRRA